MYKCKTTTTTATTTTTTVTTTSTSTTTTVEETTTPTTTTTTTTPTTTTTTPTTTTSTTTEMIVELKPSNALMSSTSKYPAGNCIDGVGRKKPICRTEKEKAPWLAIDYGCKVSVEKVVLINRGNDDGNCPSCQKQTADVEVRLSNENLLMEKKCSQAVICLQHTPDQE